MTLPLRENYSKTRRTNISNLGDHPFKKCCIISTEDSIVWENGNINEWVDSDLQELDSQGEDISEIF